MTKCKCKCSKDIACVCVCYRAVGTFARALDCSSSIRQPSLHMSAAAASRDITLVRHTHTHTHTRTHTHTHTLSPLEECPGVCSPGHRMPHGSNDQTGASQRCKSHHRKHTQTNTHKRSHTPRVWCQ